MKNEELPELITKATKLLPIAQKELQQKLNISSQDTSRLLQVMEAQQLIKREKMNKGYFIILIEKSPLESPLLNKHGIFAPCTGCKEMCLPESCAPITSWLLS